MQNCAKRTAAGHAELFSKDTIIPLFRQVPKGESPEQQTNFLFIRKDQGMHAAEKHACFSDEFLPNKSAASGAVNF